MNQFLRDTVDGGNPAPVDMEKLPIIYHGFIHLRWLAGFLPSTVLLTIDFP